MSLFDIENVRPAARNNLVTYCNDGEFEIVGLLYKDQDGEYFIYEETRRKAEDGKWYVVDEDVKPLGKDDIVLKEFLRK